MILKVFAIYDTKVQVYGMPFFMSTVGGAVRAFGDLASDRQSSVAKHPTDYVLFEIGTYDDSTGKLVTVSPVNHGLASDYLPAVNIPTEVLK